MVNNNPMFLDYKVHEEIKNQSRRDFQEGSSNKLLLEADGYLKQIIANFTRAGNNLSEAEQELSLVLEKFEKCHQLISRLPGPVPVVAVSAVPA
jgi:hypothetical protein